MQKALRRVLFASALVSLFVALGVGSGYAQDMIEIDVAPNVINIADRDVMITVHTNIPYTDVINEDNQIADVQLIIIEGVLELEINDWFSDDRGFFVAKFVLISKDARDVVNTGGFNEVWMEGFYADFSAFEGFQEIKIIEVGRKRKG